MTMEKVRENCRERLRHSSYFLISLTNHLISFKQWSHLGLLSSPLPTDIASATPLIPLLTPHFMICESGRHNCFTGHNHTTCPSMWKLRYPSAEQDMCCLHGDPSVLEQAAEQEQPQLLKGCSLVVSWHRAGQKREQLPTVPTVANYLKGIEVWICYVIM